MWHTNWPKYQLSALNGLFVFLSLNSSGGFGVPEGKMVEL